MKLKIEITLTLQFKAFNSADIADSLFNASNKLNIQFKAVVKK